MGHLDWLQAIRRYWVPAGVLVLLALALSAGVVLRQPATYRATAKAYVGVEAARSVGDLSQGITSSQSIVASYVELTSTPYVLGPAIRSLGLSESPESLSSHVTAQAAPDTVVISITAEDETPLQAADVANAVSRSLALAVEDISPGTANSTTSVRVTQIQSASASAAQRVGMTPATVVLMGFAAGIVLALLFVVLAKRFDTLIRGVSEVRSVTDSPVLGDILILPRTDPQTDSTGARNDSRLLGRLAILASSLQFSATASGARSIVITSAISGEGKTTTIANVALALASMDESVLVIDANISDPRLAERFSIDIAPGLTDVLLGRLAAESAIQHPGSGPVAVLPAGSSIDRPEELLQSKAMTELIRDLESAYRWILVDSPAMQAAPDAEILASKCDAAVIVASLNHVRLAQLRSATTSLEQLGAGPLGVILTDRPRRERALRFLTKRNRTSPTSARRGRRAQIG